MPLIFDVFEADDLGGTKLGELTDASDKRIRTELNGFGAGSFRINRHSAQVAWCEPDNLVRVKLTGGGSYVFAFFIGEGEDEAVSPDEEGGEVFTRGGRGALAYLSRAIIYPPSDVDGNRHWEDDQFGDVLNDLLDEAQTRGALADMSWDFTGTDDSDSVAWPSFDGEFVLPLGMDLLSVTAKLQSLGLEVWMQPGLTLSAYNTRGTDKTGTVHFSKGVNIREGGTRRIHASPVKSRVMVQGRSSAGALKYREVIHAGTEADARIGRRESFTQYAASGSNAMLDLAGARYLEASRDQHAGPIQVGVYSASLVPFTDYSEGDTVALTIAGLYTASEQRISAITLEETESDEYDVVLDLGGIAYESLAPGDTTGGGSGGGLPGSGGGGGGCADCPDDVVPDCSDCSRRVALLPSGVDENLTMARGQAGMHVYDGSTLVGYDCNLALTRQNDAVSSAISRIYHEAEIYTGLFAGNVVLYLDPDLGSYGTPRWTTADTIIAGDVTDVRKAWAVNAEASGTFLDTFNRANTTSPELGTADSGETWASPDGGPDNDTDAVSGGATIAVVGNKLKYVGGTDAEKNIYGIDGPWNMGRASVAYLSGLRFTYGSNADRLFVVGMGLPGETIFMAINQRASDGKFVLGIETDIDFQEAAAVALTTATDYNVRWERVPAASGGYSRARIWAAAGSEPDTWDLTVDSGDESAIINTAEGLSLYFATAYTVELDSISVSGGTALESRSLVDGSVLASYPMANTNHDIRRTPNGQHVIVVMYDETTAPPLQRFSRDVAPEGTAPTVAGWETGLQDWNVGDDFGVYRIADNVLYGHDPDGTEMWSADLNAEFGYRWPSRQVFGSAYGSGQTIVAHDGKVYVCGYIGPADWLDGSKGVVLVFDAELGTLLDEKWQTAEGGNEAAQTMALCWHGGCLWALGAVDADEFGHDSEGAPLEPAGLRGWVMKGVLGA